MKLFVYSITALMLIATAEAKKGNNGKNNEKAKQEAAEKKKKKDERDAKRDGVKDYLDTKDKNNDGSLSLDEFLTGESDVEQATAKFNGANKNGDRYLTKAEIAEMLGL